MIKERYPMINEYYNKVTDENGYFCEYYDEEMCEWQLTFLPAYKAMACALAMGKDKFHYLDNSMLKFN
jgi:hypothetical protein